jgi:hypothetical protein
MKYNKIGESMSMILPVFNQKKSQLLKIYVEHRQNK